MAGAASRRAPSGAFPLVVSTVAGGAVVAALAATIDWRFVAGLDFGAVWEYRVALLSGLGLTLEISAIAVASGLVLGVVLAILLQLRCRPLRWAILLYVELWRNTPLIVQLFWVHFALPLITGIATTALQSGILAISLQASAYLTDIARAGIQAVPRGQWEAADALGLRARHRWLMVILPQALRIMLPPLANVAISFFKTSTVLAVLAVGELMSTATRISEYSGRPIEIITFAGAVYVALGALFSFGTHRLERRMNVGQRRR